MVSLPESRDLEENSAVPRSRRPTSSNVLAPRTRCAPPERWAAVCLSYAAARENLVEVVYWLFADRSVAERPLIWDGKYLAPVEPEVDQLAELVELVCEYNDLPEVLGWALTELEHARALRNGLLELMHAAGTWNTEGGAMAATGASRELDLLLANETWHDPTQVLNEDTVPAGVAWMPISRLCEARLKAAARDEEAGRLAFVLERLRTLGAARPA